MEYWHGEDKKRYFTDHTGRIVSFQQDQTKGFPKYTDGMIKVPGYIVECDDNKKYLLFAPDMDALTHMHCYSKIIRNAKTYVADDANNSFRRCIHPAFIDDINWEIACAEVLYAPVTEMGKIYVLEQKEN